MKNHEFDAILKNLTGAILNLKKIMKCNKILEYTPKTRIQRTGTTLGLFGPTQWRWKYANFTKIVYSIWVVFSKSLKTAINCDHLTPRLSLRH